MSLRFQVSVIVVLCSGLLASCAKEQPAINRVQPDYFDKSFFVGADYLDAKDDPEYYSRGTLVDVGYGAGQDGLFTSTYAQPLTRVKWSVTQDMLIARLAYERVENSDGKGLGKATDDGIVVAAYKIESQFDIKRSYNPSTGEQTNVIEENTIDRPWSQRQYIRVDWSKNLSTDNYDYDTLSQTGIYGSITYEPLAYYINDPTAADAPHFDMDKGYLDVTNKAFAKPGMIDLSAFGGGTMPACFFDADINGGEAPATGCNPVELTIRQSFRKVTDTDYEPQDWDGERFQAFGAFTTERFGYARNYGMTDTQWHRFIERHNIWERSHVYADLDKMTGPTKCYSPDTTPAGADPHRDANGDGTEDECADVGNGSRCDTYKQRCTMPFRDRKEKPIVWYYADGSNPDYFESSRMATNDWDVGIRSAVITARYTECKRVKDSDCESKYPIMTGQQDDNDDAIFLTREVDDCRNFGGDDCEGLADRLGQSRKYSSAVIALAKMQEMVVLCHSPVEAKDPGACGSPRLPANVSALDCYNAAKNDDKTTLATCNAATISRKGDLRFNMVTEVTTPQTPSPWGIMVDAHDPLTGETVQGSVNVWSHVSDLWSQSVVDMSRYIKGELATADVTEGTYVRDWASAAGNAAHGTLPQLTKDQRMEMIGDMLQKSPAALASSAQFKNSPAYEASRTLMRKLSRVNADAQAISSTSVVYETRRKHALNTPTEAALNTKMMQSMEANANQLDSNSRLELTSPLRGGNPTMMRDLRRARELALAARGACMMNEAPAPLALADLADILQAKFGNFDVHQSKDEQLARGERMRKYVAGRANYAVLTHEMGHSMGLRHNFVSSADAFNYRPQYWQLRTDNGAIKTECTTLDPTGACIGPRYQDPITENERKNLLPMFMQSSTMDYAGETTQDMLGLGAYDFAAARMFYGESAPVYADASYKVGTPRGVGAAQKLDGFGGILGLRYVIGAANNRTTDLHYSTLQKNYDLITGCESLIASNFKPDNWNEDTQGTWNPLLDGYIVSVGGNTSRCHQQKVDYVSWQSMVGGSNTAAEHDAAGRTRVPYGFATDRWADLGNLSVYRHDNGADPYELFDFLITQQEVNHIFDNYRRNRRTFSVRTAENRQLERYNEKLRDSAKGLGLIANTYRDFAISEGYDYDTLWPVIAAENLGDNFLASGLGFDHFSNEMARPQSGPHSSGLQYGQQILRSEEDTAGNGGDVVLTVPNGATGYFGNVTPGGRPLENALSTKYGEYNSDYTVNAGSYYSKAWTAMLMTESVDNFISASRRDFLDARYRAVSLADVFPDGYRRWLANNLTGDDVLKAPRVLSTGTAPNATPTVETGTQFPTNAMGYTSWWRSTPQTCFAKKLSLECDAAPANSTPIDPQVGWEQQKFLIAFTLQYLPENAQQTWLNQLGIWELGADTDPGFTNRIELHLPSGKTYIAKTYGTETILGKKVQKGIGARILEWGNELAARAYVTTDGPDLDHDLKADWVLPTFGTNGQPLIKWDPSISAITADGFVSPSGRTGCNAQGNDQCTCSSNAACIELERYSEVPFFMRQAMRDYGLADPSMKGIY